MPGSVSRTVGASSPENPKLPQHIAVIMDGNGRWARLQGKDRLEGHRQGSESVRRIVDACARKGIRYLTLFSFSTENWRRSRTEVMGLMSIFAEKLREELRDEEMHRNGIRVRSIGDVERLPLVVKKLLRQVETRTASNPGLQLILALSYGAREEIVNATRKIAEAVRQGRLSADQLSEEMFGKFLSTSEYPDPDLLIRTGGEYRISNFLLWQIAYSELVVVPEFWPEFTKQTLERCLLEYAGRERRFGKTSEQLQGLNGESALEPFDVR